MKMTLRTICEGKEDIFVKRQRIEEELLKLNEKKQGGQGIMLYFDKPTVVFINRYTRKTVDKFKINHVFRKNGSMYYCMRSNSRVGYDLSMSGHITGYSLTDKKDNEFHSYEEFRKKFDTRFISEKLIRDLYNEKSGEVGKRYYTKRDFKRLNGTGKRVMEDFLRKFTDINRPNEYYDRHKIGDTEFNTLREWYNTYHHSGRDISITHSEGQDRVFYSSEFMGCGNGSYYLVASANTVLHVEDD